MTVYFEIDSTNDKSFYVEEILDEWNKWVYTVIMPETLDIANNTKSLVKNEEKVFYLYYGVNM